MAGIDPEKWKGKLADAKRAGKLNLSYCELPELTAQQIAQIKSAAPNIQELDLRSNHLTELPDEIAELRTLRNIKLNYNKLTNFPSVLIQLPRLTSIELGGNAIEVVDDVVGKLPACKELDISGNGLTSIDPAVASIATLTFLNLENNLLEVIPDEIGLMAGLQRLDLSNNRLPKLPDTFGQLKSLTKLDCNNNRLGAIPASMGHLKQLRELDCRYNELKEPGLGKSQGPISKFLEFLREEEERLRLEEIERLKPIPTVVGSYSEYRMKIESKVAEGGGGPDDPLDTKPYLRTGNTCTFGNNYLFIFGGTLMSHGQRKTNDLFMTNLDRMVWLRPEAHGDPPLERDGHSSAFDPINKRLLIFGGRSAQKKRLNDLCAYDFDKNTWTKLTPDGMPPAPRENATMLLINDKTVVLFGGRGSGQRFNDLHFLDLSTPKCSWSQPLISGSAPSPRQEAALCCSGTKIYVHAGRNNFILNDLFVVDTADRANMTWNEVPTSGRSPPPCYAHTMAVISGKLYTYGGYDELGGAIIKCFALDLSAGDIGAADIAETAARRSQTGSGAMMTAPKDIKTAEWIEMDCELAFNENRIAVFSRELVIYSFQVGSRALGIATHALGPDSYWDVLKHADLRDFKVKELADEDRKPINAKKMRVKHATTSKNKMNKDTDKGKLAARNRILGISPKEFKMLEYIDSFRRQFVELYPKRRPLLLDPPNECGVRKFICTTVRPSQLPYSELYDLESCADFVATYLEYEQLESAQHYPDSIPSPFAVLDWQGGDIFDLAIVLCSLLCGVGYDAYVVVGYAPKSITENDQSALICPVMEAEAEAAAAAANAPSAVTTKKSKYTVKDAIVLESQFEKEMEAKAAEEAKAAAEAAAAAAAAEAAEEAGAVDAAAEANPDAVPEPVEAEELPEEDPLDGKRVHAWVLVLAGKREVPENIFIEPTTARRYNTDTSPYLGLECLWNHTNYWVNMQVGKILGESGGTKTLTGVSFELKDPDKWEAVLEGVDPYESVMKEGGGEGGGEGGDGGEGGADEPPAEEGDPDPAKDALLMEGGSIVEMPPSWVPKLKIPREDFDTRCPRGQKTTQYQKCTHEVYAKFGECARWDGLVERLTKFSDKARTIKEEEREAYERRKDKLRSRVSFPLKHGIGESTVMFDPGSAFGIKSITTIPERERTMVFYPSARLDGLVERHEVFASKTTETFIGRGDRLVYRSVTYDPIETAKAQAAAAAAAPATTGRRKKKKTEEPPDVIKKMTEKYELPTYGEPPPTAADTAAGAPPPPPPPHKCMRKRTFNVAQNLDGPACIRVDYHYGDARITASSKTFYKDGTPARVVEVDPLERAPKESDLLEEFQRLLAAEKQCTQDIRDVEKEIKDIINNRNKEEQNISLVTPYYDIVRVKQEESDDEGDKDEEKVEHDYLSPFLPPVIAGHRLTKAEAMEVREKCLKALKDRLIERANIIQARHDEETAALAKRQANFQRDRDQMSRAEEEEYDRACDESMFRIHILEQRLKRHEEQALQKYYELDTRLRNDARLGVLMEPGAA